MRSEAQGTDYLCSHRTIQNGLMPNHGREQAAFAIGHGNCLMKRDFCSVIFSLPPPLLCVKSNEQSWGSLWHLDQPNNHRLSCTGQEKLTSSHWALAVEPLLAVSPALMCLDLSTHFCVWTGTTRSPLFEKEKRETGLLHIAAQLNYKPLEDQDHMAYVFLCSVRG